jgi:hypothetical protein
MISGYLSVLADFPKGGAFRDNSIQGFIHQTFLGANAVFGLASSLISVVENAIVWSARLGVIVWFVVRFRNRERANTMTQAGTNPDSSETRVLAHMMDALALSLLISPLVWEHHFVLAMPIMVWVAARQGTKSPWPIFLAGFVIFAVPVFDIYPLSYHRILGLLMLVLFADKSPGMTAPAGLCQ